MLIGGVARCWAGRPSLTAGGRRARCVACCVVLGTAAFAVARAVVAGTLRAEATLAAANLVYLLLMAGGAVVFPATSYGGAGTVLALLPSGALGTGMRAAFLEGGFPVLPLVVLAAWTAVGTVLTARTFTWE